MIGYKVGILEVIGPAEPDPKGRPQWTCLCLCGNPCILLESVLLVRRVRSCGCGRGIKEIREW